MRFPRFLTRTRNRLKALESYLGVYFNDEWDEFDSKKHAWSEQHADRLKYLEDTLLTKEQRKKIPGRSRFADD